MAYSLDLREKIVQAYDQGQGSQRALAALFGVSRSFVEKLLARRRTTGQLAALAHGGGRRAKCSAPELALVRRCIADQPDASLAEVCRLLQDELGTSISSSAMSRLLGKLGLPRKKNRSTPPSVTARVSRRHVKPMIS
jgi:transposase